MRLTRLYLRNYRVFEDELELELPSGLIGIYGPNGSGKSYLVESIRWTLFGQSRTAKDQVRTAGVNAECITEIEFEHEGHLYAVRRTLSGINATVRAEASADRQQVAEGVLDVARYVHSVLGMDDAAFRASVFAEQSQLAAFTGQAPAKRRELVLRLLGITPLDAARSLANKDAGEAARDHDRLRTVLPDLDALADELAEMEAGVAASTLAREQAAAAVAQASTERARAEAEAEALDQRARRHEHLLAEGRAVRAELDAAEQSATRLGVELGELDQAEARLRELAPIAERLATDDAALRAAEAIVAATAALAQLPAVVEIPPLDNLVAAAEGARAELDDARATLAALQGQHAATSAERDRARAGVERAHELSDEADCPVCGQALGESFELVRAHRVGELADAEARLGALATEAAAARAQVEAVSAGASRAEQALADARQIVADAEAARRRRADADAALATAEAALGHPLATGELDAIRASLAESRAAQAERSRLEGRLERRDEAERARAEAGAAVAAATARRAALLAEVDALDHQPAALASAMAAREAARAVADEATKAAHRAELAAAEAAVRATAARTRLTDGQAQHTRLGEVAERARHLSRTADLLGGFRQSVVESVGPRLAAQAADLFAELTDHEYDRLDVDAEHFGLQIHDAGIAYDLDRFSGSEKDLANLALRVAISEQVRFQSGGAVGLLVLDEVFGPLDEDRRGRTLLALERLRSRFRQVIVVTHAPDVKEQLPSAIEVVKLPGRRATARMVTGV